MAYKKYLIFFTLLFLFFSFILYLKVPSVNSHRDIDSSAYISNAVRFYHNNSFFNQDNPNDIPYYSLGYAFFIGLIYKFFGINDFFVIWLQVLLALLTAFLIFRTTKYIFGFRTALISYAFFSINLGFIVFSQFLLTEILLAFLLTFFFERFVLFISNKKLTNLAQAALLLGISIYVKPAAIYFIFLIIPFLMIFISGDFFYRSKIVLFFTLFFYLPVVGYMLFNQITFGQFSVVPLGNENLYFYFFPKVLAKEKRTDVAIETRYLHSLLRGNKLNKDNWKDIEDLFLFYFKKNPIVFIKVWLINVLKTCVGLFTTNLKVLVEPEVRGGDISFFKTSGTVLQRIWNYIMGGTDSWCIKFVGLFEALWSILRYVFCLISILFLILKKRWRILTLFALYLFYFSMITGHDGCARFRMMFESILIILAAQGACMVFSYKLRLRDE